MLLAASSGKRLLKIIKGDRYNKRWQLLFQLMIFFFVGYLLAFSLVLFGFEEILAMVTGLVFFFGAVFVFLVVRTGRVTIEHLLRTTGEKSFVENIIESMLDTVIVVDLDPNESIKTVNQAGLNLLGYDKHELLGKSVRMLFRDVPISRVQINNLKQENLTNVKTSVLTKDGRTIPVLFSASPLYGDRNHIEALIYSARDISEITEVRTNLLGSQLKSQGIIDTAVDGIITADKNGIIDSFNKAAEKIFGYKSNEVVGQNVNMLMPEPYHSEHTKYLGNYLRTGKRKVIGIGREVSGLRKDGTTFPMDLSLGEVDLDKQRLFTGIVRDITDRKKAEKELQEAKEVAEEATKAKSQFLAKMSHELRTPLNSVIGFSNILLKNKDNNLLKKDMTFLERIRDNGKHLLELINDVLDLSKVEAGRMELELTSISLDVLIAEIIGQFEGQVKDNGVALGADLPATVAPLQTDAGKLKQVLLNLISNALKFTEKGRVTVSVTVNDEDNYPTCIEVTDTGIGIPEDRLERIFESFEQAEVNTSRKYGGTGLGLPICKSLCELMGYRIMVESEVGVGSTFSIHLTDKHGKPVTHAEMKLTVSRSEARVSGTEIPDDQLSVLKGKMILVIDDDVDSRTLLTQYIGEFGCQTMTAGSGEKGLRLIRKHEPDLVILDLLMPEKNGWETLKELRENPEIKDIPVVVVSIVAKEELGDIRGVIDYVQKPIEREKLFWALRRNIRPSKE